MHVLAWLLLGLTLSLSGCASCGGSSTSATLCTTLCDHAKTCGREDSSYCGSGCGGLREQNLTGAAIDALARCLTESCDASRDECLKEVANDQPTRDEDRSFRKKCTASTACSLNASTCGDQNKTELLLAERVEDLGRCLEKGCASTSEALAARQCVFNLLPPGS